MKKKTICWEKFFSSFISFGPNRKWISCILFYLDSEVVMNFLITDWFVDNGSFYREFFDKEWWVFESFSSSCFNVYCNLEVFDWSFESAYKLVIMLRKAFNGKVLLLRNAVVGGGSGLCDRTLHCKRHL
jgi:hypothetical protein